MSSLSNTTTNPSGSFQVTGQSLAVSAQVSGFQPPPPPDGGSQVVNSGQEEERGRSFANNIVPFGKSAEEVARRVNGDVAPLVKEIVAEQNRINAAYVLTSVGLFLLTGHAVDTGSFFSIMMTESEEKKTNRAGALSAQMFAEVEEQLRNLGMGQEETAEFINLWKEQYQATIGGAVAVNSVPHTSFEEQWRAMMHAFSGATKEFLNAMSNVTLAAAAKEKVRELNGGASIYELLVRNSAIFGSLSRQDQENLNLIAALCDHRDDAQVAATISDINPGDPNVKTRIEELSKDVSKYHFALLNLKGTEQPRELKDTRDKRTEFESIVEKAAGGANPNHPLFKGGEAYEALERLVTWGEANPSEVSRVLDEIVRGPAGISNIIQRIDAAIAPPQGNSATP